MSTHTTYDPARNQLARLVDVLLDSNPKLHGEGLADRDPERTYLFLVTPAEFKEKRFNRLYRELNNGYRADPGLLHEHLPHRSEAETGRAAARLGWFTWEDCNSVVPGACSWLDVPRV